MPNPFVVVIRWVRTFLLFNGYLLAVVGVSVVAALFRKRERDPRARLVRLFLQSAGGAWIKLGQILAMRMDLLPAAYVDELSLLLDRVPPFPGAVARATIAAELGDPSRIFAEFPDEPVASASFGQVYRARLRSGKFVAVKVQRPGLASIVAADITALKGLAAFIDLFELLGSLRLWEQVIELETILHEEIDYRFEAHNLRDAVAATANLKIMAVPQVIDEYSSLRVLTMEYLDGVWMNDALKAIRDNDQEQLEEYRKNGIDLELVADRIFQIGMRQIFEIGTFHADPHAANIVIMANNVVGYVDFGIVGTMDERTRQSQERYFAALKDGDVGLAARSVRDMVIVPNRARGQLPAFEMALSKQLREWLRAYRDPRAGLREKSSGRVLIDTLQLIRKHGFSLSADATRYYRAMIIADVIVLQLSRRFDALTALRRYFERRRARDLRVAMREPNLRRVAGDYFNLALKGPSIIERSLIELQLSNDTFETAVSRVFAVARIVKNTAALGFLGVLVARVLFRVTDFGHFFGHERPFLTWGDALFFFALTWIIARAWE